MNVAVVGSGNGGMAVAFDWARHGHRVTLYSDPEHPDNIEAVRAKGGITSRGVLEGFAPIAYSGSDVAAAMEGAEVVLAVAPAFATEEFGHALAPHLRARMIVVICPGSCGGALAFKRAAGLAVHDDAVIVGETSTLPYASRSDGAGNVHVFHKFDRGLFAAAVPRSGSGRLLECLRQVYPSATEAATVFQTSLQNGNPVIHPAVTLMNAALLERTGGDFHFYEEGVTRSVGRVMAAVDNERLAIAAAIGVKLLAEPEIGVMQGYMTENNYSTGYSSAPGFRGIKAPATVDSRYLTEDVGYSLVFFTDLARRLGVPTPTMDAIIAMTSVVLARDLRADGARTMKSLGLDQLNTVQLLSL
ncbi:NAD/NADP octopine/nopaline dehydrogenase family protein [Actinoplanes sp. KI2]|uniref:NAD/NADP-dependent octopine/nopaline dehydrogenase family protein n=1 Tax=Actinoplanes sp. KI2 TaxID=2983315 RepID=UPI0021D5EAF9|nr:NAD/NADP-dependent octopine/nopaline dehydrogenase family protein [Actinoplanes sp. KI2]MCU7730948.1 NAD/NADP octopine/nopaline dehydrogenase family protein [Actinoplanes sp. KI2]